MIRGCYLRDFTKDKLLVDIFPKLTLLIEVYNFLAIAVSIFKGNICELIL